MEKKRFLDFILKIFIGNLKEKLKINVIIKENVVILIIF
ncbi:MAG: hypothetical protein CM15mP63_4860 [Gammaproteobacteria bacterium]|nr:MAG: hypothetical protein CM15mP63_4860 [Gammaproteobacteria bacterium]